jgi:4-amino-4-deoxy-L-arabinose transferase-like glycosyltransferase
MEGNEAATAHETLRNGTAAPLRCTVVDILCLCALFLVLVCVVRPFGNFPLNDDWAYARGAFALARSGRLEICAWTSMTQVAHLVWGALFCKLFGASFVTLRASIMVLSQCSIVFLYLLLIECRAPRWFALLAAATTLTNPIFVLLSYTYMTDVSYFCMQVLSIWMFLRAEHRRSLSCYVAAVLASLVATLIRQIGVVVPLAFALTIIWRNRKRLNWMVICASIAPVLAAALALHGFEGWLKESGQWSGRYRFLDQTLLDYFSTFRYKDTLLEFRYFALQCGLWLTPLVLCRLPDVLGGRRHIGRPYKASGRVIAFGIALTAVILCCNDGLISVDKGNVLNTYGLGPFELKDLKTLGEGSQRIGSLPYGFWLALTDVGLAMAVGFAAVLGIEWKSCRCRSSSFAKDRVLFAALIVLLNGICLFISTPIFDRYYLQFLPSLIMLLVPTFDVALEWSAQTISVCTVGAFAMFSVAAVHDYLSINEARWELLKELTQRQHVSPRQIDGGFEFNGYYLFDPYYIQKPGCDTWWVDDDRYAVTLGPLPDYKLLSARPCHLWLVPAPQQVYMMERADNKRRIGGGDIAQQQQDRPDLFAAASRTICLLQRRAEFLSQCSPRNCDVSDGPDYALDVRGEDPQINLNDPLTPDGQSKQLCLDVQAPHRTLFQVFYSNTDSPYFSEGCSIQKVIDAGRRRIYFELPAGCRHLRIDPGNSPGIYKLFRLELRS